MALQGTLKDFSLADILQLIGLQRKTGVLSLKRGEATVTVSFLEGSVVAAESAQHRMEDRLGSVLVKTGRLTEEQLGEALRVQKQKLKRLGSILVELDLIRPEELREALQIQISQMIYRLFRWGDGEYHFSQEEMLDYDREHVIPLSAESILMEGARILDEWPMIEKRLGPRSGLFVTVPNPPEPSTESPLEQHVLHFLGEPRTLQQLVESSAWGEFDTCKALYDLMGTERVERLAAEKPAGDPSPAAVSSPALAGGGKGWLGAVLGIWVGLSLLTAFLNPLNGLALFRGGHSVSDRYLRQVSRTKLERLNYAVQVFYLQNRGFPQNLEYLVVGGLVSLEDLRDPWGRPYGYAPDASGYSLQGYLPTGEEDPVLLVQEISSQ